MNNADLSLLDNIKHLFGKVGKKWVYVEKISEEFNYSPRYLQKKWFSAWEIPEELQEKVVSFTQNYISNLKK